MIGDFRAKLVRGKEFLFNPKQFIISKEKIILEDPYRERVAELRFGNELHPAEQEYVMHRQRKVAVALEKVLTDHVKDRYIPKISIVCSGGGYRATLGTVGSLCKYIIWLLVGSCVMDINKNDPCAT